MRNLPRRALCAAVVGAFVSAGPACSSEQACYEPDLEQGVDICDRLVGVCVEPGGERPAISDWTQVVPSGAMPEPIVSQTSHNNLDIIWHENRLFFAFRTAPSHFASDETVLYVVSTTDQQHWTYETSFQLLTDLREPRFLSFDGRLFLYFAVLGYSPVAFEPQYTMVSEYRGPCEWSEPETVLDPEFIPWRTRTIDGVPYLIGYVGGGGIYAPGGEPLRVFWLTTEDGKSFEPVVPGQPVVLEGGISETDFAFADDGALIAVTRNEAGDEDGWGSKICRAEPGALGEWSCVADPKKYDSPLVFAHGSGIYLIGRRNLTETGDYDLGRDDLSPEEQTSLYEREYWITPKRCSLWSVDPDALTVELLLDLPSNGDTCFASAIDLGGDQFLVYNYTSPMDDPEMKWVTGQTNPTFIYWLTITLPGGG